jgi:hypothetical protein
MVFSKTQISATLPAGFARIAGAISVLLLL